MAAQKPLRLGVFGGTFDPVHHGHLILAHDALEQARLDAVLFVPCAQSPHKGARPLARDARRVAMLKLALKPEPRFWLSRCEIDRGSPSYAIDTVDEITAAFPRGRLFWLIGEDQLHRLHQWHRWPELKKRVRFLLLARATTPRKRQAGPVLSLPRPRRVDISATEIRHRLKSRQPIDHLVPAPVAAYIRRHELYRSAR